MRYNFSELIIKNEETYVGWVEAQNPTSALTPKSRETYYKILSPDANPLGVRYGQPVTRKTSWKITCSQFFTFFSKP